MHPAVVCVCALSSSAPPSLRRKLPLGFRFLFSATNVALPAAFLRPYVALDSRSTEKRERIHVREVVVKASGRVHLFEAHAIAVWKDSSHSWIVLALCFVEFDGLTLVGFVGCGWRCWWRLRSDHWRWRVGKFEYIVSVKRRNRQKSDKRLRCFRSSLPTLLK